jgi:hypothetical protein
LHRQARCVPSSDPIGNEHRGFARERTARGTCLGKALAVDLLDQPGLFRTLSAGGTGHEKRESRRTKADEGTPMQRIAIAIVALDRH